MIIIVSRIIIFNSFSFSLVLSDKIEDNKYFHTKDRHLFECEKNPTLLNVSFLILHLNHVSCRSGKKKDFQFFVNFCCLFPLREISSNFLELCELHSISSFFFLFIQFYHFEMPSIHNSTRMSYFRILFENFHNSFISC
jgi:hypothetical protein